MTEELKQALRTIEHLRASPLMANHRAGLDAAHQLLFPLSQRPAAQAAHEPLTGCNCRWQGETQVEWCELHLAHKDAIHEWAERAKAAEAKLKATPEPVALGPLAKRNIYDAIRGAYDLGYNDARNARTVPGDSAPVYDGRSVEEDHGSALFNILSKRLKPATPEPVGEPDTVPLDALHAAERERDYWKTRARAMLDHAEGTCWYWMGDGEDHLESLVNSLPVVIRADQLRELLARPAPGVPEGEPKLTQEELLEVAKYAWLKARTADSLQFYRTLLAAAQAKGGGHA